MKTKQSVLIIVIGIVAIALVGGIALISSQFQRQGSNACELIVGHENDPCNDTNWP